MGLTESLGMGPESEGEQCLLLTGMRGILFLLVGSLEELIHHGLLALRDCLPTDSELTAKVNAPSSGIP